MSNHTRDPANPKLTCPLCETGKLLLLGSTSARCHSCGVLLGGPLLATLVRIATLPDVIGRHACECGHPEMRELPDGVFWCPACGSEVLPVGGYSRKLDTHSDAYWSGWMDGRFGNEDSSTGNTRLDSMQAPADKLDYRRGHRAGREARNSRRRSLKAS